MLQSLNFFLNAENVWKIWFYMFMTQKALKLEQKQKKKVGSFEKRLSKQYMKCWRTLISLKLIQYKTIEKYGFDAQQYILGSILILHNLKKKKWYL